MHVAINRNSIKAIELIKINNERSIFGEVYLINQFSIEILDLNLPTFLELLYLFIFNIK